MSKETWNKVIAMILAVLMLGIITAILLAFRAWSEGTPMQSPDARHYNSYSAGYVLR